LLVAIDIGGTFTDLMAFDEATGWLAQAKSLTTPNQLVEGIIDCLRMSGVDLAEITELIHGSTTAINTLIERKGAKTELRFTHVGLVPAIECYGKCAGAWGFYINESLRNLITTGKGDPNEKR